MKLKVQILEHGLLSHILGYGHQSLKTPRLDSRPVQEQIPEFRCIPCNGESRPALRLGTGWSFESISSIVLGIIYDMG